MSIIRNVYEIITESITHSFGSIREIYNSLRHVIDDDDKALDKANDEGKFIRYFYISIRNLIYLTYDIKYYSK